MPSIPHALGLLPAVPGIVHSGDLPRAAALLEEAARELREAALDRPDRLRLTLAEEGRAEARATVQRIMQGPEHVSKPIGRVMAELQGRVEGE